MEKFDFGQGGMSTREWGPKLWDSLFMMVSGAYPVEIKESNKEHLKIKKHFKYLLSGLRFTLPCSFCRESFVKFIRKIKIDDYLDSRVKLMKWLYLIKDLINKKLLKQEKEARKKGVDCKPTVESPSFISVLKKYEEKRARCNKILLRCDKTKIS